MKKKQHTAEEIIAILREVEKMQATGRTIEEARKELAGGKRHARAETASGRAPRSTPCPEPELLTFRIRSRTTSPYFSEKAQYFYNNSAETSETASPIEIPA